MKKFLRTLCLTTTVFMLLSASLTGCGRDKQAEKTTPPTTQVNTDKKEVDTSKQLKLSGYMISSNAPKLWDETLREVNKILENKINTTLAVNIINSADAKTKIPLINASGEYYDFTYVAEWNATYSTEAAKGAYLEITEDMLNKYMPRYSKALDKVNLLGIKLNGKYFCLPPTKVATNGAQGLILRKDLREKYGVLPLTKLTDVDKYLVTMAKNEKGLIPYNMSKAEYTGNLFNVFRNEYSGGDIIDTIGGAAQPVVYAAEDVNGKISSLLDESYYNVFKKTAAKMKELYDQGCFPKNPFSNEVHSRDAIVNGKSSMAVGSISDFSVLYAKAKGNNYELEFYPILTAKGRFEAPVASQGCALKADVKNVDRVMLAMDYIFEEPDIVEMLEYGIKGKSYIVDKDGKIDFPEGINTANVPYSQGAVSFWFTDSSFKKSMASWPQQRIDVENAFKKNNVVPTYGPLLITTDNIKNEIAAINNIDAVEGAALKIGMSDDVDKGMEQYIKKLKDAGYQKVVDEIKKQCAEYLKNK